MPTFFEGLRRLLKGESVFKPGEDVDGGVDSDDKAYQPDAAQPTQQPMSSSAAETVTHNTNPQVIPQATVVKVENRVSGQYLDISITIRNNSSVAIMLDKILLFGNTRELDFVLQPGMEREFVSLYNGPLLTNRNYTHCEVQYRCEPGEITYGAEHGVEFEQQPDGTYTISRIRFYSPVKQLTW